MPIYINYGIEEEKTMERLNQLLIYHDDQENLIVEEHYEDEDPSYALEDQDWEKLLWHDP